MVYQLGGAFQEGCLGRGRVRAELIYNPYAGQNIVRHELQDVLMYLKRNGWIVTMQETCRRFEAAELARQAVERGARVVIAAGGDGTVNEVMGSLVGTDVALGVLPVGTTNVWALQMRIPTLNSMHPSALFVRWVSELERRNEVAWPHHLSRTILLEAARVLVEGRTVAVDVGQVAGRYFLLWTGIGLDAAIAQSVSPEEKKSLGSWAYVVPALDTIQMYPDVQVILEMDGQSVRRNTPLIVVSNIQLYGAVWPLGARARVDDGRLDVCIFKGKGLFTFVRHAIKVLSGQHVRDPEIEYFQCSQLTVASTVPLPVHADDEPFTRTPVTIRTLPQSLKVIVPPCAPRTLFCRS